MIVVQPLASVDDLVSKVRKMGEGSQKEVSPSFKNVTKTSPTLPRRYSLARYAQVCVQIFPST